MITLDDIEERAKKFDEKIEVLSVGIDELIFEQKTKMNCFYCARYGNNWKCPPRIPDMDYKAMMQEYKYAAFVYKSFEINTENKESIRTYSSLHIHKCLLDLEKFLYDNNISDAISFIGGSCKLCKTGCGKEKCNNPYLARVPVEATGINVVKTLEKKGVPVVFPVVNEMKRIGLLLWD